MLKTVTGKNTIRYSESEFCVFDFYGECRWYLPSPEEGSVGNLGTAVKQDVRHQEQPGNLWYKNLLISSVDFMTLNSNWDNSKAFTSALLCYERGIYRINSVAYLIADFFFFFILTFLGIGVCRMDSDSVMHSTISSADSAWSKHHTMASPTFVLSGVNSLSMSSSLSLWLLKTLINLK